MLAAQSTRVNVSPCLTSWLKEAKADADCCVILIVGRSFRGITASFFSPFNATFSVSLVFP